MHIPSSMLNGAICPVTAIVSAVSVGGMAFVATRVKEKPTAMRFGAVSAFVFASQMMNFPIQSGTSGHLLGGMLAATLLGNCFGILAMALVLLIQCLVFSDGGLSVLGTNILNMAVIGLGVGGLLRKYLSKISSDSSISHSISIGFVAWLSVVMAALACSIELAISWTIPLSKIVGSMISIHALIGIVEGTITVAAYHLFSARPLKASPKWIVSAPLLGSVVIGALLSPFACGFPDGLEWFAQKYKFLHESAPSFINPLVNYTISFMPHSKISIAMAGLLGVLITFFGAWLLAEMLSWKKLSMSEKEA